MSKRKLLLADDSITIQKVVNLTFADEGIEVVTAGDGDAAMKKFVESQPDLVMADVNMPGVDGYKICEMIKQDDETKNIPVILLVGSFEPFDEEEARRVGADGYLTKPFQSIRQLVNKVSSLLDMTNGQEINAEENNQFEETPPLTEPETDQISDTNLGDAGMDDEMIQTTHNADFSVSGVGSSESDFDNEFEDDVSENKDLSVEEGEKTDFIDAEADTAPLDEESYGFRESQKASVESAGDLSNQESEFMSEEGENANVSQQISADQNDPVTETENSISETADYSPLLNFDEFDLLELPGTEFGQQTESASQDSAESAGNQLAGEHNLTIGGSQQLNLSPELIEAVASRVAEKISDKAVKEIMKQLAPQMVELIKRMAEERSKE